MHYYDVIDGSESLKIVEKGRGEQIGGKYGGESHAVAVKLYPLALFVEVERGAVVEIDGLYVAVVAV